VARFSLGWLAVGVGVVLLAWGHRTFWPELTTVVIIVLIVLAAFVIPDYLESDEGVRVPIPASKLEGGVEFLSPGQVVGLNAVVPNASKTPEAKVSTYGQVVELRGKEAPVVVIEVSPSVAENLQTLLLADGAKITYRLLKGTPTPATPETPPTDVTPPGPRGQVADGLGYLEIKKADIESRVSTLEAGASARLVVVQKREEAPVGKPESVTTTYSQTHFCVTVVAFLDKNGMKQSKYDDPGKTEFVLVSFEIANLDPIALSLAAAESIWLENQSNCQ
jgi:hypothetical protein